MSYSSLYRLGEYVIIFDNIYDHDIYRDEISDGIILRNNQLQIEIIHQFDVGYDLFIIEDNKITKRLKINEESIKLLPPGIKIEKA